MVRIAQTKYQLPMYIIHPGEYRVTTEDEILATVLGSCISVVLHDPERGCTGMNHFMLARHHSSTPIFADDACRYGMYAMEELINGMLKTGCLRSRLSAKIFGGGHVIGAASPGTAGPDHRHNTMEGIPESNIRFAHEFLELEGIPVLAADTGGHTGRKIMAFSRTFKVLLKRLRDSRLDSTILEEAEYLQSLKTKKSRDFTLLS